MRLLYWTPRILGIVFILFLSLFALDVFGEYVFPLVLLALFMHLIPSIVLAAILAIAWKWENIGGYVFLGMSIVFTFFFDTYKDTITFLLISFPVFITGALFIISYYKSRK